jgi:hypothetical protein
VETRDRPVAVGASPGEVTQFGPGLRSGVLPTPGWSRVGSSPSPLQQRRRLSHVIPVLLSPFDPHCRN